MIHKNILIGSAMIDDNHMYSRFCLVYFVCKTLFDVFMRKLLDAMEGFCASRACAWMLGVALVWRR